MVTDTGKVIALRLSELRDDTARRIFGAYWNFATGTGTVGLLPIYPDSEKALPDCLEGLSGENSRKRIYRSAPTVSFARKWEVVIPRDIIEKHRKKSQYKGMDPLVR